MILAGFLLVHEAVLGPGGLQPVTGVLVIGKHALQLESFDGLLVHPHHIIGRVKTKSAHRLEVTLKVVLEQELLQSSFGHHEDG